MHGPAAEAKAHQLITMCEDFFKYQQGFFSRAFISSTLEVINGILDSSAFHKAMRGAKRYGVFVSFPLLCLTLWIVSETIFWLIT